MYNVFGMLGEMGANQTLRYDHQQMKKAVSLKYPYLCDHEKDVELQLKRIVLESSNGGEHQVIEKIAAYTLRFLYRQQKINLTFFKNWHLTKILYLDLVFNMIASYSYRMMFNDKIEIKRTLIDQCFYTATEIIKLKDNVLKKNGNNFPLPQFLFVEPRNAQNAETRKGIPNYNLFHCLIDYGWAKSILASSSPGKNPYLLNVTGKNSFNNTNAFLQSFMNAPVGHREVEDFLERVEDEFKVYYYHEKALHKTRSGTGISANKEKQNDYLVKIKKLNRKAYAVLNQYFIERFTNINFIISYFDYASNFKTGAAKNYFLEFVLETLVTLPLLKTRLAVLEQLKINSLVLKQLETDVGLTEKDYTNISLFCRTDEDFFKLGTALYKDIEYLIYELIPFMIPLFHYFIALSQIDDNTLRGSVSAYLESVYTEPTTVSGNIPSRVFSPTTSMKTYKFFNYDKNVPNPRLRTRKQSQHISYLQPVEKIHEVYPVTNAELEKYNKRINNRIKKILTDGEIKQYTELKNGDHSNPQILNDFIFYKYGLWVSKIRLDDKVISLYNDAYSKFGHYYPLKKDNFSGFPEQQAKIDKCWDYLGEGYYFEFISKVDSTPLYTGFIESDFYNLTGNEKEQFDKLVAYFAKKFGTKSGNKDSWEDWNDFKLNAE